MNNCCICNIELVGQCLICGSCFSAWPKGKTFSEYMNMPYNPDPIVIPAGVGTCEEAPHE